MAAVNTYSSANQIKLTSLTWYFVSDRFERLSLARLFTSVSFWARHLFKTSNQDSGKWYVWYLVYWINDEFVGWYSWFRSVSSIPSSHSLHWPALPCLRLVPFLTANISQASVSKRLRCGGVWHVMLHGSCPPTSRGHIDTHYIPAQRWRCTRTSPLFPHPRLI